MGFSFLFVGVLTHLMFTENEDTLSCHYNKNYFSVSVTSQATWNLCQSGYFLVGFYRITDRNVVQNLEEGVCCKPLTTPHIYSDCYEEIDHVMYGFDNEYGEVRCTRPQYYIVGIYTDIGESINFIKKFRCCRMG